MSEPSFEVSERARALRNPAKTGPLVYYPSGWGTGHTERSAGPTMVRSADRSHQSGQPSRPLPHVFFSIGVFT